MQPKPHFFCEHCGAEVPLHAKNCPGCGRAFQAVRCPKCNFTGEEALFKDGCPACGYAPPAAPAAQPVAKPAKKARAARAEPLPLWVYAVSGLIALAIVLLILRQLM